MCSRNENIIKVKSPSKKDICILRITIVGGMVSMLLFARWFFTSEHIGHLVFYLLLTFALIFRLVKTLHEWYHYWSPSVPSTTGKKMNFTVDVLTTACPGEPREMIVNTLKAMVAIRYPHCNYLCDEGNDPYLKKACDELGVIHVTRTEKINAKAGNINNALKQATGEICVVLDPDHVPVPEFLDRTLSYFEDGNVGFVQCVQGYGNQKESFIARGAAEQTYHFYGPMMMCMNTYGTVQAIGANCTFRREALDSIGGHAAGLAEDMHTAMQLHAKGWKSVYIPEMLTRGLVPATLSAYYKQQLKWSRGAFELLFRTVPKLWQNFTWRQKIHYLCIPFFFLFGLINLIDIAIPLLALTFSESPWEINLGHFGMYFAPVCIFSLLIRLYAQRWLLEEHEKGFHLAGGILLCATWWIYLIGFIYSIFNVKVPYIPTPKEDEHRNYLKLSLPNVGIVLFTACIIAYGLMVDWTPYSLAMSCYAIFTAGMLGFIVLMSQQKFLEQASAFARRSFVLSRCSDLLSSSFIKIQQSIYYLLKSPVTISMIAVSSLFLNYSGSFFEPKLDLSFQLKQTGGFYMGSEISSAVSESALFQKKMNSFFNVIALPEKAFEFGETLPVNLLNEVKENAAIPLVKWDFSSGKIKPAMIRNGTFDIYLKKCAQLLRNYQQPVFVSLSAPDTISPGEFVKCWQYLYTYLNNLGVSNVTWLWCPKNAEGKKFWPGDQFVDWIGWQCLNYADEKSKKDWFSFEDLYMNFREDFGEFKKPVMITRLGCVSGAAQADWLDQSLADIAEKFPEIHSVIFFEGHKQFKVFNGADSSLYTCDFKWMNPKEENNIHNHIEGSRLAGISPIHETGKPEKNQSASAFVKGKPGKFELQIKGKPYYIKGVAFNTAHDWRDGYMPLTRKQLKKDFQAIREMGANTVRRYGSGIYDRNIMNLASEYDLKVLYGFWFDPKVDYYRDSAKVKEYLEEVNELVMNYKDHHAVLGWSLGNETWGLLKHKFVKPYLTKVRESYLNMIEKMARSIHQLDPDHPVFSCMEHEEYQLAGELAAFSDRVPSVDVIGVNSYYHEQICQLNHKAWEFDSLRPYLVSEFGPRGYWNPKYNHTKEHSLVEESDSEKADWYRLQWNKYVQGYKGYNVGGFAYCWHDRMEGSLTWFGLSDYKGRLKPAYHALKEAWTGKEKEEMLKVEITGPQSQTPGSACTFTANCTATQKPLKYEWILLKDEYLDKMPLDFDEDTNTAEVNIPKYPSNYRLYVFVSHNNRNVATASVPIKVEHLKR